MTVFKEKALTRNEDPSIAISLISAGSLLLFLLLPLSRTRFSQKLRQSLDSFNTNYAGNTRFNQYLPAGKGLITWIAGKSIR